MKSSKGVSLVELVVVIALIGIMAVYVVVRLRAHTSNQSVNQTVVEMQYILEAAKVYYQESQAGGGAPSWPARFKDLYDSDSLPAGSECSPWPAKSGSSYCRSLQTYTISSQPNYFIVELKAPNATIAEQIQNQLPSSFILNDGVTVAASVGSPGGNRGWLVAGGIVEGKDNLYLPNCPEGYEGHYVVSPQQYVTGWGSEYTPAMFLSIIGGLIKKGLECTSLKNKRTSVKLGYSSVYDASSSSPYVTAYMSVDACTDKDKSPVSAYFLTFCIPDGSWQGLAWEKDNQYSAQCNRGDWRTYNPGTAGC